jgi:site-specific recombinase XerD
MTLSLGQLVHSFFEDHLKTQRGLQPNSIRSYRDALRLYLCFVAEQHRSMVTKLKLTDLTFDHTQRFLKHLEVGRKNQIRSRNQRLVALRVFFEYVASRLPEMLDVCERVALIPLKRTPPPETRFMQREELATLFRRLNTKDGSLLRDRTLLLFLYNTGARVQEVADIRLGHLQLQPPLRVRLHGKGNKWRTCPLWPETAEQLRLLVEQRKQVPDANTPVFVSRAGCALTRSGIYKIVRRHCCQLDASGAYPGRVSPHLFRHTAAVHLLESGVEVNVIRGWLGHVSLETTNRYAEISAQLKEAALRVCELPWETSAAFPRRVIWRDDENLLNWLNSL